MKSKYFIIIILLTYFTFCIFCYKAKAQLWEPIPPYNLLWPLWSPVLSPPDPVTGKPTPLIDYLYENTVLPVQPAFIWNPELPYFNILYNSPPSYVGDTTLPTLYYYEPTEASLLPSTYSSTAFQVWPPTYLEEPVEVAPDVFVDLPVAIDLPVGYETLINFDPIAWLNFSIPFLNALWQTTYYINPYLLSAAIYILPIGFIWRPMLLRLCYYNDITVYNNN